MEIYLFDPDTKFIFLAGYRILGWKHFCVEFYKSVSSLVIFYPYTRFLCFSKNYSCSVVDPPYFKFFVLLISISFSFAHLSSSFLNFTSQVFFYVSH